MDSGASGTFYVPICPVPLFLELISREPRLRDERDSATIPRSTCFKDTPKYASK